MKDRLSNGTITGCYAEGGSVSGEATVRGLVGVLNWGATITDCYVDGGSVSGTRCVGGLVGENYWGEVIEVMDSFWDTQTSGQVTNDGRTGKTTAEMQVESTFTDAGWDFGDESVNGTEDIWWILEGQDYPRLWWEKVEE